MGVGGREIEKINHNFSPFTLISYFKTNFDLFCLGGREIVFCFKTLENRKRRKGGAGGTLAGGKVVVFRKNRQKMAFWENRGIRSKDESSLRPSCSNHLQHKGCMDLCSNLVYNCNNSCCRKLNYIVQSFFGNSLIHQ